MPFLKAATDAAFGLQPYSAPLRVQSYPKAATTTIFAGDIVTLLGSGLVTYLNDNFTGPIVGVAAETTLSASAGTTILCYDHPDQLYACQSDEVGTALAATNLGNTFGWTGNIPGTAALVTRGRSTGQIDSSVSATTIGLPIQFIALHPIETSGFAAAAGSPRKCIVKIHQFFNFYASTSAAI